MIWQTIGFEKNKFFFDKIFKEKSFGHAYIFSGQEMIGKRTFALELAQLVTSNSPADICFISPADSENGKTIAIEDVRKAKDFAMLSPYWGEYKFIVIDNAETMTVEAQNALLKILEEPNQSSILVLITATPSALLTTINSRCQEIRFTVHPQNVVDSFISKYDFSKNNAEFIKQFANGRLGLIKKIAEEKIFEEVKESVEELMSLVKADFNDRFVIAQRMTDEKNKSKLESKVLYWMLYMHTRLDEPKAHKILNCLMALNRTINKPQFNQRLALENFLIQI